MNRCCHHHFRGQCLTVLGVVMFLTTLVMAWRLTVPLLVLMFAYQMIQRMVTAEQGASVTAPTQAQWSNRR